MQFEQNKLKTKRVYKKPQLRTIELAADEVMAFGCKLVNAGTAFGPLPCSSGNCSEIGTS